MHTEALAFQAAIPLAIQHLPEVKQPDGASPTVVFQMDNLPLVQHFNKAAKCSHLAAARIMARSALSLFCQVHNATVEYIPRESNVFADYAAGLASAFLLRQATAENKPAHDEDCTDSFETSLALPQLDSAEANHLVPQVGPIELVEKPSVSLIEITRFLNQFLFLNETHRHAAHTYANMESTTKNTCFRVSYRIPTILQGSTTLTALPITSTSF